MLMEQWVNEGSPYSPSTQPSQMTMAFITGNGKVILSGGVLGSFSIEATHCFLSWTSGWPGNKDATCLKVGGQILGIRSQRQQVFCSGPNV